MALMLNNENELLELFIHMVDEAVHLDMKQVDIWLDRDINAFISMESIDRLRFTYTNDTFFYFKFLIDLKKTDSNSDKSIINLHKYFRLAGQVYFVEFQVFAGEEDYSETNFAIENVVAGYEIEFSNTYRKYFVVRNKESVKEQTMLLRDKFAQYQPVVKALGEEEINLSLYEEKEDHEGIIYIPLFPIYIEEHEIRENFGDSEIMSNLGYVPWTFLERIFTIPSINNSHIIIHQDTLEAIVNDMRVNYSGFISIEEDIKSKVRERVVAYLNKKDKQNLLTIIPSSAIKYDQLAKLLIYSNNDLSFYIRPSNQYSEKENNYFFPINNKKLSEGIYVHLDMLKNYKNSGIFDKIISY